MVHRCDPRACWPGSHFLLVRPANQKREFLQRDIAQKQAALANFDRSIEAGHILGAKIDRLRPVIALVDSRLGPNNEMNKVLEELWRLAEANSLQTRTVKTPPDKRSENFSEQEIELSLSGNFGGYYQFLLQLEEMKRIVRIKRMSLKKANTRDGQVQAELTLSVYFAPGPI